MRPVFVVAPPCSGASLLASALARSPGAWTLDGESDQVVKAIPNLHPRNRGWDSNRLAAQDASPDAVARLEAGLRAKEHGVRDGDAGHEGEHARLVETASSSSLRVPFLGAAFPNALFIYVDREPRVCLMSSLAAWESGRCVTYPDLPGWDGPAWSLALTPEWRKLIATELSEIVAEQWRMAAAILVRDLEILPSWRWTATAYGDLTADPDGELARLCEFAGLEWSPESSLPLAGAAEPPRSTSAASLDHVLSRTAEVAGRASGLLARGHTSAPPAARPPPGSPYRSVSGGNFAQILAELGSSLLVSTYQTNKLVALRELDGGLNTHFRPLENPMGIAYRDGRLAVGTASQVWEYHNLPQLTAKLDPPGRHDACFVPRTVTYTGDIRIHDVAWVGGELWVVATRFSCLATLDGRHSFVPRWQPSFITALAAEDRCHLNGMAVIDDKVRFVTALGETDTVGGWRENKASGGVLIDVGSGETVTSGLSMPHSPRWHRDSLWVLESGEGSLATVDLETGSVQTVAKVPGFTRGLAFAGPLAFIGLSEVREATTFGGLPLTGRLEERQCGVWVVNVESGETVAFLRFEDLVEEIFEVCLLPGVRFPEIAEHGSQAVNDSFVLPDGDLP